MKKSASGLPPLLVEWSTGRVRVFDPVTRESVVGTSLAECLATPQPGRDVIVAVGQRSTFIRTLAVPAVAKDEIARMVGFKLAPLLPAGAGEYVSGFRLGRDRGANGHLAVVGAIKTASLRRIYQEAAENGLRVRAVLPLAFGSWLAARSRSLADCAVAEVRGRSLYVDVIAGGELRYSRSVPIEDPSEIPAEIAKTFAIAELPPSSVVSTASPEIPADFLDPRESIEFLGDLSAIQKLLFSLELPERRQAERTRAQNWVAIRALAAAFVAVAYGAYVVQGRSTVAMNEENQARNQETKMRRAETARKEALARADQAHAAKAIIEAAFRPAQSFSDVIAVLGADTSSKAWLTGLSLERGKPILVHGHALDSATVAKYVADLSREPRFRNFKVVSANKSAIDQKPVVQFAISGHAIGNLPIDLVATTATQKPGTGAAKPTVTSPDKSGTTVASNGGGR